MCPRSLFMNKVHWAKPLRTRTAYEVLLISSSATMMTVSRDPRTLIVLLHDRKVLMS